MADVLVAAVDKRELGKTYKKAAKAITDALEGMSEEEKAGVQSELEAGKPCRITVDGAVYDISSSMLQIKKEKKKLTGRCVIYASWQTKPTHHFSLRPVSNEDLRDTAIQQQSLFIIS